MPAPTAPLPIIGENNSTADLKVLAAFAELRSILTGAADASNLAASAKPATLMGAYRVVSEITAVVAGGLPAGPWGTSADGPSPIVPADFAVAGLTTQFRLRVLTGVNSTAPGVDFTYGLYPVTGFTGGSGFVGIAGFGTVVPGSTVTRVAPSAGAVLLDASADFTIATPGAYQVLASISGTSAAASKVEFVAELQVRNV